MCELFVYVQLFMMLYKNGYRFSFPMRLINAKVVYMCALTTLELMVLQPASRGHHFLIDSAALMLMQFSKGDYVSCQKKNKLMCLNI